MAVLVGTHLLAYHQGKANVQAEWDKVEAVRVQKAEQALKTQKEESEALVKDLKEKLSESQSRQEKVKVVTKEVVKYVTKEADSKCVVTSGFEWMWNMSINPELAGSAPGNVDEETGIKISEVAAAASANNAECQARGEVIEAWQEWYERSRISFEKAKKSSQAP